VEAADAPEDTEAAAGAGSEPRAVDSDEDAAEAVPEGTVPEVPKVREVPAAPEFLAVEAADVREDGEPAGLFRVCLWEWPWAAGDDGEAEVLAGADSVAVEEAAVGAVAVAQA